jgi:DNA-binding CsgD family transcriptional regulator
MGGPARQGRADSGTAGLAEPGAWFSRMIRVAEPGGVTACTLLSRADSDFGAAASAMLAALAPHLAIALRTFAVLERARFRSRMAEQTLHRAGLGWAALDDQGRILETDAAADPFVHHSKAAGSSNRLAATAATLAGSAGEILRPDAQSPVQILVEPAPAITTVAMVPPAAVAIFRGPPPVGANRARLLAHSLGLTSGEARLALLLADGCRLAEAAAELGLTIETTRTYSKRLFAKTRTRGQPELVRLVLQDAAMLCL